MVKSVDTRDLKSLGQQWPCRFDSGLGHQLPRGFLWCIDSSHSVIVLNLQCELGHRFEGWFATPEKFAEQRDAHSLECPLCGSAHIDRLPSAPSITRGAKPAAAPPAMREALSQLRKWVQGAENVGQRFPEEARRMHYGEIEKRDIRGTASIEAVLEMADEGIPVLPVPAVVAEETH